MNSEIKKEKQCHFCVNNMSEIDYKDTRMLQRFVNSYKKILPSKRTGTCSWHQRKLATAIKRSRAMALLPYTNK